MDDDRVAEMVVVVLTKILERQRRQRVIGRVEREPFDKVAAYCPPELRYSYTGNGEKRTGQNAKHTGNAPGNSQAECA